jgi:hypothetical protein
MTDPNPNPKPNPPVHKHTRFPVLRLPLHQSCVDVDDVADRCTGRTDIDSTRTQSPPKNTSKEAITSVAKSTTSSPDVLELHLCRTMHIEAPFSVGQHTAVQEQRHSALQDALPQKGRNSLVSRRSGTVVGFVQAGLACRRLPCMQMAIIPSTRAAENGRLT